MTILLAFMVGVAGTSYWLGQDSSTHPAHSANQNNVEQSVIERTKQENSTNETQLLSSQVSTSSLENAATSSGPIIENQESESIQIVQLNQQAAETIISPESIESKKISEPLLTTERMEEPAQHVLSGEPKTPVQFDLSKVEGAPESLLAKFQSAVDASNEEVASTTPQSKQNEVFDTSEVRTLTDMPNSFQGAVPNLQFDMHIYASDGGGFVKVNGRERYEGDIVGDGVKLVKILPQKVILVFQGEQFSLPALASW